MLPNSAGATAGDSGQQLTGTMSTNGTVSLADLAGVRSLHSHAYRPGRLPATALLRRRVPAFLDGRNQRRTYLTWPLAEPTAPAWQGCRARLGSVLRGRLIPNRSCEEDVFRWWWIREASGPAVSGPTM